MPGLRWSDRGDPPWACATAGQTAQRDPQPRRARRGARVGGRFPSWLGAPRVWPRFPRPCRHIVRAVIAWRGTQDGKGRRTGDGGRGARRPPLPSSRWWTDRSASLGARHATAPSCCNDNITAAGRVLGGGAASPPPATPLGVVLAFLAGVVRPTPSDEQPRWTPWPPYGPEGYPGCRTGHQTEERRPHRPTGAPHEQQRATIGKPRCARAIGRVGAVMLSLQHPRSSARSSSSGAWPRGSVVAL